MENSVVFEKPTLKGRLKSMLRVDFRRMLKSKLFYIIVAISLLTPILMTVMLTMMDGKVSTDPQTGLPGEPMEGPDYAWQSIGAMPSLENNDTQEKAEEGGMEAMGAGMDVMAMCNINMAFMGVAVFVCLFISDDFRSGYAKNLFTVRSKKTDYVISKTIVGFTCGALMLIAYFIGAMLGGAVSGLSFAFEGFTPANLVMCILAKIFLMLVFVSIFTLISIGAKQRAWLSICGSLGGGMLLFMMVSMITPLNSTFINVILCLVGGTLFAVGLGAISNVVLKKTSLVG